MIPALVRPPESLVLQPVSGVGPHAAWLQAVGSNNCTLSVELTTYPMNRVWSDKMCGHGLLGLHKLLAGGTVLFISANTVLVSSQNWYLI
jgi:hypothetical protein